MCSYLCRGIYDAIFLSNVTKHPAVVKTNVFTVYQHGWHTYMTAVSHGCLMTMLLLRIVNGFITQYKFLYLLYYSAVLQDE